MKKIIALILAMLLITLPAMAQEEERGYDFSTMELNDIYGEPFDMSVFNQRPTMLVIWATWCGYCVKEAPLLSKLSEEYEDKLNIVGVLTDAVSEDGKTEDESALASAKALYEAHGLKYSSLIPDANLLDLLYNGVGVSAFPTALFLDGEGTIRYYVVGGQEEAQMREILDGILGEFAQGA